MQGYVRFIKTNNSAKHGQQKCMQDGQNAQNKGKMNREILLEMYEKLWNADKDKWAWNVILKDTLEKLETKDDTERQGFVSLIEHYVK